MAGAVEARVIDRDGQKFVVFPDGTEVPMAQVQAAMTQQADYMPPPRADAAFTPTVPTAGSSYQFGDVGRDAGNEALQAAYTQLASAVNPQSRNLLDVATNYATGTAGGLLSGAIGLGQKAGGYAADVLGAGAEALGSDRWSRGGAAQALYGDMGAGAQAAGLGTEANALGLLSELGAGKYARGAIADRLNQTGPVPTMYSNPIAGLLDNPKSGITAYHGSPHSFDKFSMDKIGTGEGAQAYGPGLYFAENEGVARGYRDALSGRNYRMAGGSDEAANMFGRDVVDIFESSGGNRGEISNTLGRLRNQVTQGLQEAGVNSISKLDDNFNPLFVADIKATNDRAERLAAFLRSDYAKLDEGSMYEVNINANPEDFLDWERPMSEQPQVVRDFAKTRWQQIYGRDPDPSIEGEYIAKMASPQSGIDNPDWLLRGGPADDQRERLRAAGIPGIRYLDAGSRSFTPTTIKDTPSGSELYWGNDPRPVDVFPTRQAAEEAAKQFDTRSRNYVVFDENLINIVKKYGIAGAAAMLGMSTIDVEKAMAGQSQQPPSQGLLAINPR
jgi:hypothetical protein